MRNLILLLALSLSFWVGRAQEIRELGVDTSYVQTDILAIKSNLLYDVTTTFNLGIEFRLSNHLTLELPFNYNPWTFSGNRKVKHWLVQPELRYWVNKSFKGSFFGLHIHGAQLNTSKIIDSYRYEGWLVGAGISYGYRWNFSRKWGLEATIGVGYASIDYSKYTAEAATPEGCGTCGTKISSDKKSYWGPTKVGISLIYTIGRKTKKTSTTEFVYTPPVEVETVQPAPAVTPQVSAPEKDTVTVQPVQHQMKSHQEVGNAYIVFPVNQYIMLPSFKHNSEELAQIQRSVNAVRSIQGVIIEKITIESYASPEGGLNHNIELSTKRAIALKNYMVATCGLKASSFVVRSRGENWEGLREAIANISLLTEKEKSDVYHILDIQDLAARKISRGPHLRRQTSSDACNSAAT